MNRTVNIMEGRRSRRLLSLRLGLIAAVIAMLFVLPSVEPLLEQAFAQDAPPSNYTPPTPPTPLTPQGGDDPGSRADEALSAEESDGASDGESSSTSDTGDSPRVELLELLVQGGELMWPIFAMSLLVVTFGVERLLGLRTRRVLPQGLVRKIRELLVSPERNVALDKIQRCCEYYPSASSNVIRSVLRRAGRPASEVAHAVSESCDREAARLYANVRWLSLAAGVTPLLGLLGTVWGMIQAFFATANLPAGANKADYLAEGIYVALVTTFAGLAVAIPASVLAHMFEGRIQRLFRDLDELLEDLVPYLETAPLAPPVVAYDSSSAGSASSYATHGSPEDASTTRSPVYGDSSSSPPLLTPAPPNSQY